jgi:hypothetical protein
MVRRKRLGLGLEPEEGILQMSTPKNPLSSGSIVYTLSVHPHRDAADLPASLNLLEDDRAFRLLALA